MNFPSGMVIDRRIVGIMGAVSRKTDLGRGGYERRRYFCSTCAGEGRVMLRRKVMYVLTAFSSRFLCCLLPDEDVIKLTIC